MSAYQSEDRVRVTTGSIGLIKSMWPYFMRHKLLFFASVVGVLSVAIAARFAVTIFGHAIDEGLLKDQRGVIIACAIAYFLLEGGRCFMNFLSTFMFAKVGNRVLFELREQVIDHVQKLPIGYFDRNPTGRIVTRVTNDVASLGELFTQGLISVFVSMVSLFAIIGAMAVISWKMTLGTLLIAPPLIWIIVTINRRMILVLRDSKAKIAAINAFVAENINGMRVLQLYGRVGKNVDRFKFLSRDYRDQQMKTVRLYALLWPTTSFFNGASVAAAIFFGGRFVTGGEVTMGQMVAFVMHVSAFIGPLHQILEKYQVLQESITGAERIFTLFDERAEEWTLQGRSEKRFNGEIEFKDLSFKYRDELPLALKNANLRVKPGQSVALVGRTGSGKSTTIALLQRFYDPSAGEIIIDGRSISEIDKRELRSRIGVVQQDTFLFRGTIAENISLGDPNVSREKVEEVAKMASLTDLISKRPQGLDSAVEERGANLSVGERQLIAFARILAFDPDILILDEATANIDSRTESLIQEATRRIRQGRTSFIIAHRISTIMDCDQIVVLDHGEIRETGTHEELKARGGIYSALVHAQVKS